MQKIWTVGGIILLCFLFTGCANQSEQTNTEEVIAVQNESTYDATMADSLDEAVLIAKDTEKKQIRLQNIQTGKTYKLSYTGATTIQDKNGKELVMEQLSEGSLLTVTFLKDKKEAKAVYMREDGEVYQDVVMFEINKAAHTMVFNGEQYDLDKNVAVVSEGKKMELMDLNSQDTLTVSAVDHTIYSIAISKGHGYLRLVNYDYFVGGWIEVGQSVIKPVVEGMLLTVPEGSYTMQISKDGIGGNKEITVVRNEEVEVDVSDLHMEIDEEEAGKIIFTISPEDAVLYIDGDETDYSAEVTLSYGIHKLVCKADGYATLTKYIKVNTEYASIDITMEEASSTSGNSTGQSTSTGTTTNSDSSVSNNTATASSDYSVYIDAPTGAELYLDGSYIGIIPTSFPKKAGTYTVSIRRTGYQTRSYSLEIDSTAKDVTYSFSDLVQSSTE